jgi:exodeoxyribonuclease III
MRLMSWNINRGLARDLPRVISEEVDVAVLCEASMAAPAAAFDMPQVSWCSTGELGDRGLVVAGFGIEMCALPERQRQGRWTMAARSDAGFGVVGIWTCPRSGPYGPQAAASIDAYRDFLAEQPCIIAGDFNVSPNGTEDSKSGVLRDIFEDLADLGYHSAYHQFTGCAYGEEADPTYFHRYLRDEPFHIDFVFMHEALLAGLTDVTIGSFDDWVAGTPGNAGHSDHVPLIIDFEFPVLP